jgi:ubiquitin-like-conjugating enzyme ATG3
MNDHTNYLLQRNLSQLVTFWPTSFPYGSGMCRSPCMRHTFTVSWTSREKGDPSKAREFLPAEKQYLVTRGVPCLRRAQSLAYTDADEDAERLLSFGDTSATGNEEDEWVETHAGRKPTLDSAANPGDIDDIPDLDGEGDGGRGIAHEMAGLSLGAGSGAGKAEAADVPLNLDDIPDMEEDLEEADEATAAPKSAPVVSGDAVAR